MNVKIRPADASRLRRDSMGAPSGVLRAEKDAPDRPGFLTRGVTTRSRPSRDPKVQWLTGARPDQCERCRLQWRDRVGVPPTSLGRRGERRLWSDYNRLPSASFFINIYRDFSGREETFTQ